MKTSRQFHLAAIGFAALVCLLLAGCSTTKAREAEKAQELTQAQMPKKPEDIVIPPVVLHKVAPEYPSDPNALNVGGEVEALLHVTATGSVDRVTIIKTTDDRFVAPSVDALAKWTFEPGTCNGKPIDFLFFQTLHFTMVPAGSVDSK